MKAHIITIATIEKLNFGWSSAHGIRVWSDWVIVIVPGIVTDRSDLCGVSDWVVSNFYLLKTDTDLHWSANGKLTACTGLALWSASHLSRLHPSFLHYLILTCASVRDKCRGSLLLFPLLLSFYAMFPFASVSLTLALSLQGTVLLPFRGQSSLHCWRQVAKDTSTQSQTLNVIRWKRCVERGERGSSSGRIWSVGSQTTPLCCIENTKHPLLPATWSVPVVDRVWFFVFEIYAGLSPHAHVSSAVFVFCAAVHLSALNAGLTLNLNRHGAAG